MVDFLLKEDGDFLLLETGDKIILEDGTAPPTVGGVDIVGTHATVDLRGLGRKKRRVLVYTLEATARIATSSTFTASGKIQSLAEHKAQAKILSITEKRAYSKIIVSYNALAEAKTYTKDDSKLEKYRMTHRVTNEILAQRKERLRKLFEEYKEEFEQEE